jgi:hypothetical protein
MNKKINLIICFFVCTLLHGNAYGFARTGKQATKTITKTVPTVAPRTPTIRPTGIPSYQPSPGNIPSASKSLASEKTQRALELKREQQWSPSRPEEFVMSENSTELERSYAEEQLKNDIPYFKNLIQQSRDVGFGPESLQKFENSIDFIQTAEDIPSDTIQKLSNGFAALKNAIETKKMVLQLANLIQEAKVFPANQIDIEPYKELTQSLMDETIPQTVLKQKNEVTTMLLKLKQSIRRLQHEEAEKKEKQEAEERRKLIEAFAEETAEEKAAREIKEAQEKTEKPIRKPLKIRIPKTIPELPTQEFIERQAAEKLQAEEEAAQQKAAQEQAKLTEEQLKKEVDILHEQIDKEFTDAQLAEQERITTEAHIKEIERQQEEAAANKATQEKLLVEIAEEEKKLDQLERNHQERELKIEQLQKEWKEKEAALELEIQKEAEARAAQQEIEKLEAALAELETLQRQQLQPQELGQAKLKQQTEQLSSQELGKAKLEQEPIKETKEQQKEEQKEEERKKEEKKEEQEKKKAEEKTERNESGNIPTKTTVEPIEITKIETTTGGEQKQPITPQKKPSSIPQEESKETEAITTTQPKKEIAPIPEETIYQPIEQPSFAQGGVYPEPVEGEGRQQTSPMGRPTGITPRRPAPQPSAYSPQTPTPPFTPSTSYGGGGTPSSAESIGGSALSPIDPYTGRIEVRKPVAPKKEVPAQETTIEKKVQPGEQVWWEKLLPKWMVQYLGRKDRTIREKAAVEKPLLRSTSSEGQATEKPAKEASIIETIVETIKKPVANAISYIRELLGVS